MVKKFFYRIFCGFFLGLSVFAPGFSGSVIAIIMGIYQDLLSIASNPLKNFKQNVKYGLPLGLGVGISAVLFVIFFKFLFGTYEKATYFLFAGLIAGNLPVIYSEIKKCKFQKRYMLAFAGAFAVAFFLGSATSGGTADAEALSANLIMLSLGGFVAGGALLVPGMSVSMILIILGIYGHLIFGIELLLHFDFSYLLPIVLFCVCALAGLVMTSRQIKAVFRKFPGFANSMVLGFMSGSLVSILVRSMRLDTAGFTWLFGGAMLIAGLLISMFFLLLGRKMSRE